jgi:hypothetical protein
VGRLLQWHPGSGTVEIATNVAELDGGLALVNWDGTSGELLADLIDPPTQLPLRLTSLRAIDVNLSGEDYVALSAATANGELIVMHGSYEDLSNDLALHTETVASHVLAGEYGWYSQNILAYTRDGGDGTGTLVVRFVDSGDEFEQRGVSRWQFSWIDQSIRYFVDSGSQVGLWLARFR